MKSRELIKLLKKNGWILVRVKGDHHIFKHPDKDELITITHPRKDLSIGLEKDALKKMGLK